MMYFILAAYAVLLSFPIAEAVLYPGITFKNIGVQPYVLAILGVFLSIGVRYFIDQKVWSRLGKLTLLMITPVLTMLCLGLRYLEVLTYPNYVYSTFHIDITSTEQLALYLILIALPFIQKEYFQKYLSFTVIALSTYLYHILLLAWSHPNVYIYIKPEDGIIEYATCFTYLFGSIAAFWSLRHISKLKLATAQKKMLMGLSILMGLSLFLIAGEEVSWGQRILGIEISEETAAANTQGELNIHNNRMVFGYVYTAYLLLNLYGLLSWIGFRLVKDRVPEFWKVLLRLCTSRWYTMLFFIPNLVYISLMSSEISGWSLQWEEVSELYLAAGLFAWMALNMRYLRGKVVKKKG